MSTEEGLLRKRLEEACSIIHDVPILKIHIPTALARGEDEAVSYAKNLSEWVSRTGEFMKKVKENGNEE